MEKAPAKSRGRMSGLFLLYQTVKKPLYESFDKLCMRIGSKDGHPYVFWITGSLAGKRQVINKTQFATDFRRFYPKGEPERYKALLEKQLKRNQIKIEDAQS